MFTHFDLQGADGVRLHAVAAGDSGPLILFLHGFPEFWQAWHGQLDDFGRDFRAVALDLRGYNLSAKPKGVAAYTLPRLLDDIRQVLRTLSPDGPAILVGHDWGGIIGWALARESPELLHRLVIINAPHPAIFFRELKKSVRQQLASSYALYFQMHVVAEITLRAFNYAALRAMVFGVSAKPQRFSPKLRAAYHDAWSQPHALSATLNYYRNPRTLKRVLDSPLSWVIQVPTLVLWGDKDPALRHTNLDGIGDYVKRLTLRRHPSATHWLVHEEPEWVNSAIRDFVAAESS